MINVDKAYTLLKKTPNVKEVTPVAFSRVAIFDTYKILVTPEQVVVIPTASAYTAQMLAAFTLAAETCYVIERSCRI